MTRFLRSLLLALAGLALSAVPPPLVLEPGGRTPLAGHMEVLEGPPVASLEGALRAAAEGRFQPLRGNLARGYGLDPIWVRFALAVPAAGLPMQWLEVRPGDLHRITLYLPDPGGGHTARTFGALVPFSSREVPHHTVVFPLGGADRPLPGPVATCYLQVDTQGPRLLAPILWTPSAFSRAATTEGLMFGAFYGIGLILALANLIYWRKVRDPIQVQYACYLLSTVLLIATLEGHAGQFLFPGSTRSITWLLPLAIIPMPWVAVHIFSTLTQFGTVNPRLDRAYRAFSLAVSGLALVPSVLGHYYTVAPLIQVALLLIVLCNLGGAAFMAARGHRTATFYLLAFSPYLVGALFRIARNFSLAPPGFLGDYAMYLGAIAHFALMTLPLAVHLGRFRRERDQALAEAMEASQRHQRELENEVDARTRELREEQSRTLAALEAERRVVADQRQFLSMVSHEFRTPLAVMDGAAQMARLSVDPPPPELLRSSQAVQSGVGTLLHLLDTWLTTDRIASGLRELKVGPVDPAALLSGLVQRASEATQREVRLDLGDLPPTLPWDRDLMGAAIQNLLDNALKYAPEDRPVGVRARLHEGWLHLEVLDEGQGIPADQLPQIGSRYFRGRNVGAIPGMGLGLHLVRTIAELHGGRMEVESIVGRGTTARLLLPSGPAAPGL